MRALSRSQRQRLGDSLRVRFGRGAAGKPALALFREEVEAARLAVFREEPDWPATLVAFSLEPAEEEDEEARALRRHSPGFELRVLHVDGDEFVYDAEGLAPFLAGLARRCAPHRTVLLLETVRDRVAALRYKEGAGTLTPAQLDEALFAVGFAHGVDHEFADTPAQSLAHLLGLLNAFTRVQRRAGPGFAFDAARPGDDSKARLLGLTEECSLAFARVLGVLPGVSEERAAAVVARHPTFKLLKLAYESAPSPEAREALLEDVPCAGVAARDAPAERRALGPALSRRICLFLHSSLRNELL